MKNVKDIFTRYGVELVNAFYCYDMYTSKIPRRPDIAYYWNPVTGEHTKQIISWDYGNRWDGVKPDVIFKNIQGVSKEMLDLIHSECVESADNTGAKEYSVTLTKKFLSQKPDERHTVTASSEAEAVVKAKALHSQDNDSDRILINCGDFHTDMHKLGGKWCNRQVLNATPHEPPQLGVSSFRC